MLIEITTALLASRGPLPAVQLGELVWPEIGERWAVDGRPITPADVQRQVHAASAVLQALDLVDTTDSTWSAGPSATTLLPGATLRAQIWAAASLDQ